MTSLELAFGRVSQLVVGLQHSTHQLATRHTLRAAVPVVVTGEQGGEQASKVVDVSDVVPSVHLAPARHIIPRMAEVDYLLQVQSLDQTAYNYCTTHTTHMFPGTCGSRALTMMFPECRSPCSKSCSWSSTTAEASWYITLAANGVFR